MDTQENEEKFLKEIESDIGLLKFYKKKGHIDVAYTRVPLNNGYHLSILCQYVYPLSEWDIANSFFTVAIIDKDFFIQELYDDLEDKDPDFLQYRINYGVWDYLSFKDISSKFELASKLENKL